MKRSFAELYEEARKNPAYWQEAAELAMAERDALRAELAALRGQKPVAWMIPERCDHNGPSGPFFYPQKNKPFESWKLVPLYTTPQPAQDDARDAERYRWLRNNAEQGAVKTLLPLYRAHFVIVSEPVEQFPDFGDAIDAAILAAKGEQP